jgi:hypothetical protein
MFPEGTPSNHRLANIIFRSIRNQPSTEVPTASPAFRQCEKDVKSLLLKYSFETIKEYMKKVIDDPDPFWVNTIRSAETPGSFFSRKFEVIKEQYDMKAPPASLRVDSRQKSGIDMPDYMRTGYRVKSKIY